MVPDETVAQQPINMPAEHPEMGQRRHQWIVVGACVTTAHGLLKAARIECSRVESCIDLRRSVCMHPAAEKTRSTPAVEVEPWDGSRHGIPRARGDHD